MAPEKLLLSFGGKKPNIKMNNLEFLRGCLLGLVFLRTVLELCSLGYID